MTSTAPKASDSPSGVHASGEVGEMPATPSDWLDPVSSLVASGRHLDPGSLRLLVHAEDRLVVIRPMGPSAPCRVAMPGALIVARASGVPIEPWAIRARPALRLQGRWDRHVVPLPFSRLRVAAGQRLIVAEREPLRPGLKALQAALDDVAARTGD